MATTTSDANMFEESRELPVAATSPQYLTSRIPKEEDHFYDLQKRGLCIILNHYKYIPEYFKKTPSTRDGTFADLDRLKSTFDMINFDVEPHTDLTYDQIMKVMKEVSKRDHSQTSCLAVCVMTHGAEGGVLMCADGAYLKNDIFRWFTGDICPGLAGKPKLFFVQACRGDKYDYGVKVASSKATFRGPASPSMLLAV